MENWRRYYTSSSGKGSYRRNRYATLCNVQGVMITYAAYLILSSANKTASLMNLWRPSRYHRRWYRDIKKTCILYLRCLRHDVYRKSHLTTFVETDDNTSLKSRKLQDSQERITVWKSYVREEETEITSLQISMQCNLIQVYVSEDFATEIPL